LFQFFPVSAGKGNGVRASLKAAGNSREVPGRIKKRGNLHHRFSFAFSCPVFFFCCKDNASECSLSYGKL